ncbi:MAG TPA: hypothetical protein VGJ09_05040 [Bryobacteraceae bacterium]
MGDTNWYVSDVLAFHSGRISSGPHPLLEFGHLIWRPIGALVYPAIHAIPESAQPGAKLQWLLSGFSVILGIAAAAIMYDIVLGLGAPAFLAFVVSADLLCADACLTYFKTANSYVPGLFCVTLALWFATECVRSRVPRPQFALLAGASMGFAALFWFTNILLLPAILAAVLVWNTPSWKRDDWLSPARIRSAAAALAGFAVIVIAGYSIGAFLRGVRSPAEFAIWYRTANHGWDQNRNYLRAVSGFPRMLFDLSGDGIALKRYVFHDPYSPVSFAALVTSVLWKIAAFYLCLAALLYSFRVGRKHHARKHQEGVVVFGAALATLGFFAIALFEPSTPSRFISLLPFWSLALATGYLASGATVLRRAALIAIPSLAAFVNLWTLTVHNPCSGALAARFDQILKTAHPGDMAVAITGLDDLYFTADQCRMQPEEDSAGLIVRTLLETGNQSAPQWRDSVAENASQVWGRGGDLWIPKRLLADTPAPTWNWTEGDNPALKWSDFPAWFRRFSFDADVGGPDGFLRLAHTPENSARLRRQL